MKSFMANPSNIERKWYVVDAADKTLGRLAAEVAKILRGKHKPTFTPHMDTGDHVIVINADKVVLTGKNSFRKLISVTAVILAAQASLPQAKCLPKPVRMVELAVKGMIPHNRLGSRIFTKLHVYAGAEHPHAAQKPEVLEINVR